MDQQKKVGIRGFSGKIFEKYRIQNSAHRRSKMVCEIISEMQSQSPPPRYT